MTVRVAVCYGKPEDTDEFDDYYTRVHVPLANQVPGLRKFAWGKVTSMDGSEPPHYAIASLYFDDTAALRTALASPEMGVAGKDVANFATGGATMFIHDEEEVGP